MQKTNSLAAGVLLAATIAGQSPQLRELTRNLRSTPFGTPEHDAVVEQLLGFRTAGARVVAGRVAELAQAEAGSIHKNRKAILRQFERVAGRLLQQRSKGRDSEIQELREAGLALMKDRKLGKADVRSVCDPAVAKLRELLTVSVPEAVAADEDLVRMGAAVEASLANLSALKSTWKQAGKAVVPSSWRERLLESFETPPDPDAIRTSLDAELEQLAFFATPMPASDAETMRKNANVAAGADLQPGEFDGVRALNQLRVLLGRPALRIDIKLCTACRDHSDDMRRLDFFSHTSPVEGKRTPSARAAKAGSSAGAENIARGNPTGPAAITAWWYSPGHHRNMLALHGRIGLGRSENFWTQLFGG